MPSLSRRLVTTAALAASTVPRPSVAPAFAWCGALPAIRIQLAMVRVWSPGGSHNAAAMRVVGDATVEKGKKLGHCWSSHRLDPTYEYLEPLGALTISERRVAFVLPVPTERWTSNAAAAAAEKLESKRCMCSPTARQQPPHLVFRHDSLCCIPYPRVAAELIGGADASQREALSQSLAPLLDAAGIRRQSDAHVRRCRAERVEGASGCCGCASIWNTALREDCCSRSRRRPLRRLLRRQPAAHSNDLVSSAAASRVPILVTRGSSDVSAKPRHSTSSNACAMRSSSVSMAARRWRMEQRADNAAILEFLDAVDGVATRRAVVLPGTMARVAR